jgi:hypothetical protein
LLKFKAGTGLVSGVFCGVAAEGACCAQHAMVTKANRVTVAASRMVELIRANGIYSSPIVKTTWIKAWLRKKLILCLVQPTQNKSLLRHWYAKERWKVPES